MDWAQFSQVIESNGKLFPYLNLSQVKWRGGVPKCETMVYRPEVSGIKAAVPEK